MHREPLTDRRWVAAALAALCWGCGDGDIDRRIDARPGGAVAIDVELGSGMSFDHGSLEVTSEAIDEVRVTTDTSGWGGYAVDVDIRENAGQVRVIGRVDGALHWMFGGPTVDFRVVVPHGLRVEVGLRGGDLLLEDLVGSVTAEVDGTPITLRRAEGAVRLVSNGGAILIEDVDGTVRIESGGGDVLVTGVRGRIDADSGDGPTQIASVTGAVEIVTGRSPIRLSRVRGDVRVRSERGSIDIDDVAGAVDAETTRGRIQVVGLDGPIRAHSKRGGIDIEFVSAPAGSIQTTRGSIRVEAPSLYGFDLDADTERGGIEIDSRFSFSRPPQSTGLPAGPFSEDQIRELEQLGEQVAAEVQSRAAEQWTDVQREWERWRQTGDTNWDPGPSLERWSKPWPWDHHGWEWNDRDLGREYGDWAREMVDRHTLRAARKRGTQMVGQVNGGGPLLRLRTERGSIQIDP